MTYTELVQYVCTYIIVQSMVIYLMISPRLDPCWDQGGYSIWSAGLWRMQSMECWPLEETVHGVLASGGSSIGGAGLWRMQYTECWPLEDEVYGVLASGGCSIWNTVYRPYVQLHADTSITMAARLHHDLNFPKPSSRLACWVGTPVLHTLYMVV